jgi:lipoprotein-releasing system ATP-binding protein
MSRVIECRKVVKTYYDAGRELRILRGIDLSIYEGEVMAISGPSGAGKSTLLHLIGTLDRPTSGEILFRDTAISKLGRRAVDQIRNKQVGFVFQFYHLLPEFTALENVMMPAVCKGARRAACRDRGVELLTKVGLEDRMTHKPGQLSGGEQQRVAIARALFNSPSVILADEPTGNLDERTGEGIMDLLWKLNETDLITLIIVSHDEKLAVRAHRWIHLHEGVATPRQA